MEDFKPEDYFEVLTAVRDEGSINPLSAGQFLQDEYDLTRSQARAAIVAWMHSFRRTA